MEEYSVLAKRRYVQAERIALVVQSWPVAVQKAVCIDFGVG